MAGAPRAAKTDRLGRTWKKLSSPALSFALTLWNNQPGAAPIQLNTCRWTQSVARALLQWNIISPLSARPTRMKSSWMPHTSRARCCHCNRRLQPARNPRVGVTLLIAAATGKWRPFPNLNIFNWQQRCRMPDQSSNSPELFFDHYIRFCHWITNSSQH